MAVNDNTFRSAGGRIGAKENDPGLRFFTSRPNSLAFGPGAGLVLAFSVGTGSLRAGLVDANGTVLHPVELDEDQAQLERGSSRAIGRLKEAGARVLDAAFAEAAISEDPFSHLLVDQALPLLGVAVAWPIPLDRRDHAVGRAFVAPSWKGSLSERVARALGIASDRSHALNDADAAAISVAFDRTRATNHVSQPYPELTFVVRMAGGLGGATIVIEPPQDHPRWGKTSGFTKSTLLGGVDTLAGEIGHVAVPEGLVEQLNQQPRLSGLRSLEAVQCSCGDDGASERHLEAFASIGAVCARVGGGGTTRDVLDKVLSNPESPRSKRVFEDCAALLAKCLEGPIAWLNPARIVLTGALATDVLRDAVDERLLDVHPITTQPQVIALRGDPNAFARVRGAGLAILREHVHRDLVDILGGPKKTLPERLGNLVEPITSLPWQ